MTTQEFLDEMAKGTRVVCGSPLHQKMHELSQDALKITMQINNAYHTPEELRDLFALLTGRTVDESFGLFPPFSTDCGKNIRVGRPLPRPRAYRARRVDWRECHDSPRRDRG